MPEADSSFHIREAKPEDFEGWASLFQEIHEHHLDARPSFFKGADEAGLREMFQRFLVKEAGTLLVAENGGRLVGFANLEIRSSPDVPILRKRRFGVLDALVVAESERRRGIGRALVEASIRYVKKEGASELELSVWEFNESAIAFYESLGFETMTRRMRMDLTHDMKDEK
jgi:ribosomal protein S18 acetylase RimI-like enzyme